MGSWGDRLRPVRRLIGPVEAWEIRRFGRSGIGLLARTEVLVLETTGRRTGRPRATPLACHPMGDDGWLVAGGAGGQTGVGWVANLRARPEARVVVGRKAVCVRAEEQTGDAGAALHAVARERWPQIRRYEASSGRITPVFLLRPLD